MVALSEELKGHSNKDLLDGGSETKKEQMAMIFQKSNDKTW